MILATKKQNSYKQYMLENIMQLFSRQKVQDLPSPMFSITACRPEPDVGIIVHVGFEQIKRSVILAASRSFMHLFL